MPYFDASLHTRQERQEYLHDVYGFDCSCAVCSAAPAEVEASDIRRGRISDLKDIVEGWSQNTTEPEEALAAIEEALGLYEEEKYDASCVFFLFLFLFLKLRFPLRC